MELSDSEWNAAINAINGTVRENFVSAKGDFAPSMFGSRNDWWFDLETRGHIEISAQFSRSGRPVVIERDELIGGAA